MKLLKKDWIINIDFEDEKVHTVYIENIFYFRKLIFDLQGQCLGRDAGFSLYDAAQNKMLDLSKCSCIISDLFNLDINNKKIITKIIAGLRDVALEDIVYLKEHISSLENFIDNLIFDYEIPLRRTQDIELEDLLKVSNIELYSEGDLADRLLTYMELHSSLLKVKLFIAVNLSKYFSKLEYENLIKEIAGREYYLLNIEYLMLVNLLDSDTEKKYIIDKDLCDI